MKWFRRNVIGYNWWALEHISARGIWAPCKVLTIFGRPMCTILFRAAGPFDSELGCFNWAQTRSINDLKGRE